MTVTRTSLALVIAATLWAARPIGVIASDELDRAKELYRSAAYDEALDLLDDIPTANSSEGIEVNEYRVFCLVALDRKDDARKAMATLVTASPSYAMSETEAAPRVRTMFAEVRRSLLPSVIQRLYADAKASFDRKDPKALGQFERVLTLLKDRDVAGNSALADLTTVATGFRDLSKALIAASPATPPPPANRVEAPAPSAAIAPVLVPPVVISQAVPIAQLREEREWNGEIEVTIDDRGRVISARMTKPIHPVYDQQLLRAAQSWTYKPALRDGFPIPFVKVITINLDTRPVCTSRNTDGCRQPLETR
jgi:TonB family protein